MQEGTNSLRKLRRDWWKTKLCTACVSPLGRFLSRGGICPQCGLRVCKNCRSELESGAWVCVLCSNGMPSDDLAKTTKSLGRDSRSIRRSWTISNPQRAQTNSPILKSYTVLYPEDGELTDGIAGSSGDVLEGGECSASAGHLSRAEDTCGNMNDNGSKLHFFGGSDQGINSSNKGGQPGGINHKKNHHHHHTNNSGSRTNNDECVNGLSTTRQFHSLPRMIGASGGLSLFATSSSSSPSAKGRALGLNSNNKVGKRSFNPEFDKENIKRHRSFQTTLHPYTPPQLNPPSPAASINFIEETFWDYYDYEIENSSDPSSTPRNPRKTVLLPQTERKISTNSNPTPITKSKPLRNFRSQSAEGSLRPSTLVAFRTDSNRSSCERSLGETMDYDCSLKTNQFSSLSDTEINETSSKDHRGNIKSPYSTAASGYRRHSNVETSPRSTYHYATISSTTNPYLPASEYVYRRRHDEMMMPEAPPKPERKYRNSKRSVSLNAYDGRRLFSPLRTYCVLMKENIEPGDQQNVEESRNPNINITSGSSSLNNPGRESSKSKSNLENNAAATPTSSAIHKSSTPISQSFSTTTPSSSPHKFNSLPRERFIRIEREDGDGNASMNIEKYSSLKYPSKKSEVLLGKSHQHHHLHQQQQQISGSSREKNVTRVPIFKDDNDHDRFSSIRNFPSASSTSTSFPAKNKIERSQSYKEISSSRPYPYYHHYHPQNHSDINSQNMQPQSIQFATSNNAGSASAAASENIRYRFPDKSSSTADLNFMPSRTSTLPNFRSRTSGNKGQNVSSSSASVWNEKKEQNSSSSSRPNHFFQSDFGDDESDVVIENFIKTHSSSNSNTLPKRKYPPSTTHISNSNTSQRDKEYSYGEQELTSMKSDMKSSFQQDSLGDNYLRQCSTFPRGGVRTRSSKHEEVDTVAPSQPQPLSSSSSPKQTETLPKPYKNRNYNNSFDFPKGYSNVEKIDVFFHPSSSPPAAAAASASQFDVPKQSNQLNQSERLVPIKMMAGPGSSATLPHPYIRRNKQMTVAPPLEKSPVDQGPFPITTSSVNSPEESGPSISQVEMEIERDIFYQKTRSLDRVRPSSKSKLKSVLSIGRSSNGGANADQNQSNAHQPHHYPMEIDYSDSQPYFNKGRRDESIFSIDQVDRNYANGRSNSANIISNGNSSKSIHTTGNSSDQLLLEPQQIHSAPIPSPRLKRKGKIQAQPNTTGSSSSSNTLCSPKINGDEMSSSSSNIHPTSKLVGPGTNYGSKKLSSTSSSSGRLVNELDHYNQHQTTSTSSSIRNDLDILRKTNGGGGGGGAPITNPISLGNTSLNASRSSSSLPNSNSSKLSLVKETSIHADNKNHHHHHHHQTVSIGMSNSGDGIQSEKSSVTNYISQPSTTSATPNYSNSDGPGVNFMISNSQSPNMSSSSSPQFNSMQQLQQPLASASSSHSSPKYFSESKTKAQAPVEHYSNTNKKSALATTADASSKLNKAVRFEPHVIAMEIELEQRKLLQQQLSGLSASATGGAPSSPQLVNNNNMMTATINSSSSGSNNANGSKSNTGNHMHRHGSQHNGNKSRQNQHQQQQHYVHASSYLPVLYHSYHQQQHKYIRKGASGTVAGSGSSGKKNKSKKYKGFVARAIAKVKSKAAAAALVSSASTNKKGGVDSSPTVYYPVGKQEKNSSSKEEVLQNLNANNPSSSSVITYISPQPQAHEQPPVQQSLDESSAIALQQQYQKVPSITVSLSSEEVADSSLTGDHTVHSETPLKKGILVKTNSQTQKGVGIGLTKIISESPGAHPVNKPVAKYVITPAGRLKKNLHKINAKGLSSPKISSSSTRRMDGYLDENMDQGLYPFGPSESDERHPQGLPIPSSFTLQTDEITPSSTSSSSSSFTSNLQESYELFHNQTLPDRVAHELSQNAGEDKEIKNIDDPERCDSLDEDDEDSDNIDDDGPSPFKSFDESDFDEDEEADFVFYPTPKSSSSTNNFSISKQPITSPTSSSARHLIDTDHHDHLNKAITTSIVTSSTDAHAPFGSNINETTTKGNNGNNNHHHHQYSDSASDRAKSNNVMKKGKSKSEPKMVVGIPTYRSPNSTRAPHPHHHHINSHHGKSQASIPNANPTIISSAQENVKQKFKEPHPLQQQLNQEVLLLQQEEFTRKVANENINDLDNAISLPMHKDSSRVHTKLSSEDVSHERKGLLLSHHQNHAQQAGKPLAQHIKNENQVDVDEELQSHSQPFVPFNDKRSISKGRHESQASAVIHKSSSSTSCACEHEHERNVDDHVDHDEDTLQKDVKNASATTTTSTGGVPMSYNGAESCKERVDDDHDNPHDAKANGKGFLQTLSTSEGIASATTKENSTGNANNVTVAHNKCNSTQAKAIPGFSKNDIDEYEGRLTDLTTTITRSSRSSNSNTNNGQQLAGLEEKLEDEEEEGLHSSASAKYLKDDDKSAPTHSNSNNVGGEQKLNSSGESSQVRTSSTSTSSWASKNVEKKNHKSVTTTKNFHQEQAQAQHQKDKKDKDAERLARLELVKKQQNLISKDFEILSSKSVENENECEVSGIGSNSNSTSSPQPNSLETQFGNDQSFLSESEISSGKSPSPSPRFKSRNKNKISKGGSGGGGGRLVPKFKTGSKVAGGGDCDSGSEEEAISHSHLLNAHQTQSQGVGRQSQSRSREIAAEEEEDSPLFSPDSGPFGMSMLPPQQQQHSATSSSSLPSGSGSSDVNNFIGKFKSRVLLNSDDLEDDEELAQHVADAIHNNKGLRNSDIQRVPSVKRNITTVEISGDVGIVSSGGDVHNLQDVVNISGSGGGGGAPPPNAAVSRQTSLSNDHLQSSGLSLILQPTSIDLNSSDDDDSIEKPIEPQIRTQLVNNEVDNQHHLIGEEELLEVGSSVSANESSGDNDTEKTTTSDDNSSDWQSESTNTVIFRGNPKIKKGDYNNTNSDTDIDPCPPSLYGNNHSYLDPEIQINNITVGDDFPAYHQSNHNSGNDVTSTSSNNSPAELSSKSNAKVSVGYKATKVNKVSTDLIIGIKKSSADNVDRDSSSGGSQSNNSNVKVGSKRKFDKNNDVSSSSSSSSSSSTVDSSEELGKSNETLTDINEVTTQDHVVHVQLPPSPEDQEHLEVEMVMQGDTKVVNGNSSRLYVPNSNSNKSPHQRRESPEGQEQEVPDHSSSEKDNKPRAKPPISEKPSGKVADATLCDMKMEEGGGDGEGGGGEGNNGKPKKNGKSSSSKGSISKDRIVQSVLSQIPSRSSPDGADADKSDRDATPEPEVESPTPGGVIDSFDVTSDEDSWVEEILFEDEDETSFEEAVKKLPPPLDLTLHTIVEESCEESEAENSGNFYQPSTSGIGGSQKNHSLSQSDSNANELEKYFNFGIYNDHSSSAKNSLPNEESEFSDTFSESSFSLQEEDFDNGTEGLLDPAELASTRLEKYFYNLGVPQSMMNPMSSTMNQHADSDSVGSESDSDNSVLEKRKKVLKHHRRSADFEEEFGDKVSDEEDSFVFGQDGFDTIKKTARKTKKSGSEGSISNDSTLQQSNQSSNDNADTSGDPSSVFENKSPKTLKKSDSSDSSSKTSPSPSNNEKPVIKVNRSNSFTWSSDEEVNIMMSKLRQLIKNLIKSKAEAGSAQSSGVGGESAQASTSEVGGESRGSISKDKQLVYLENELIRLMKTDNLKNIVEYLSSEESDVDDVYKFIKVVNSSGSTPVDLSDLGDLGDLDIDDPNLLENLQSTMQLQEHGGAVAGSPKSSPALLAKVMHHIGNRLNMWMKDEGNLEDDNNDDSATIKCAPSVSSDLNEDRFSWKGSFESALAAKRQSVGSTDSISSSDYGPDKSMLRSSSLHHLTTSQPIEENREEEEPSSSLPRMTNLCNSLPRLNQPANPAISRAHSLVMTAKSEQPGTETYPISISGPVKSARYRPPGFQPIMKAKRIDTEEKASPAILSQSTPVLTQDPAMLKNRSDSMGSIFHDVKPLISVKGQVEFGLQYNYKLACLEVKVVGCRDLAAADLKRNRSDPYVKAYLLPDKSKAGKRKTKTKKNTLSPTFDEILKFPLTLSDLQNRTLWLSVWHSDMFGKNEFLGEVLVNLKDRVFDDPNPGWWDLQEMSGQMEDMPKGDVVIALKWQPKTDSTGNLSVLVKEAKNLVPVKNGSPSTFVKCALLSEKTRKQKTSICRRNFNPIWNQTLLFEDVDDDGVEITIWNHDLLASHDLIGTVRIEYDNPLWESMISRPSFWVEGGLKLS